ncbi:MAG: tRNA (guanosine(37)-N1)-methyltransferase TrmD [Firmicutes bacterium]|nr:tRNA (guanosine(37)-N1)-methyltransferase TrmD [Bacillota bacterium]
MKIDILTLFPNLFNGFLSESIIKRAIEAGKVQINLIDFRKYTKLNNNQVDDTAFGGGAGMVIMCDPIVSALEDIKTKDSHVILLDPKGKLYNQKKAQVLKEYKHLILICGHYEGIDERIKHFVDEVIGIGDYILTGGEVPAMVIADSVIRLLPGVIAGDSLESESFNNNLLDYPVYTKPREYRGLEVPEVLLSGDHKKIAEFRYNEALRLTKENRPDLLEKSNE